MRHGPRFLGNKQGFMKEFYERRLPSQEPSLPAFYLALLVIIWEHYGSTFLPGRG